MDPLLVQELTRDEGMQHEAYRDSLGNWTIGIGHLLGSRPRMTEITTNEAQALLAGDVAEAIEIVADLFAPLSLLKHVNGPRYRALVNMAFNLGYKLRVFKKFRAAVLAENWPLAATEMLDSLWAKQVGSRATRLAHMIQFNEESE
jgi:lysozyme